MENVEVDLAKRLVTRRGEEVHLTPTEYSILPYLAEHPDRVVTHRLLLNSTMGPGYEDALGSLRVFIASLRKKLEEDPAEPRLLLTEPGVGYRLRTDGPVVFGLRQGPVLFLAFIATKWATRCRSGHSSERREGKTDRIPGSAVWELCLKQRVLQGATRSTSALQRVMKHRICGIPGVRSVLRRV